MALGLGYAAGRGVAGLAMDQCLWNMKLDLGNPSLEGRYNIVVLGSAHRLWLSAFYAPTCHMAFWSRFTVWLRSSNNTNNDNV